MVQADMLDKRLFNKDVRGSRPPLSDVWAVGLEEKCWCLLFNYSHGWNKPMCRLRFVCRRLNANFDIVFYQRGNNCVGVRKFTA